MATIIIDNREIEIGDDERLNGIQAAARAGVEIPHYCWHPGLSVVASCRMCLVESGSVNEHGKVQMAPKLVPACQTPAKDGTVFVTNSENVRSARAMVEEDLLLNHPIDCPICDKAGECFLQDYHFKHGRDQRRADIRPFTSRRRSLGETVTLFVDRCVMCTRCVRFAREVSGTSELMVSSRGHKEEIDVFPGFPLANKLSGNVVDLCPVGALGDKDSLYQQRVWFMRSHDGVCAGCSTGCSIRVDENQDRVYRLRPRENPHVNQWWMCDEGRYGFHHLHSVRRMTELRVRKMASRVGTGDQRGVSKNGDEVAGDGYVNLEWSELPERLAQDLKRVGRLAAVLSPHLTVEEAYLLATYVRSIDPTARVAAGPAPTVGEDESFSSGFTIRAEKCPNRRGVEEVAAHFMRGECLGENSGETSGGYSFDDLLSEIEAGAVRAAWVTGGYKKDDWISEETAAVFDSLDLLIVQDMFASPLWERADYQLPGAGFAEREGSYVNFADRLQSSRWAIRPPAGAQSEGRLCWRLLERSGLYDAKAVLNEIAREITYFTAAMGQIPAVGVDLKVYQLAGS